MFEHIKQKFHDIKNDIHRTTSSGDGPSRSRESWVAAVAEAARGGDDDDDDQDDAEDFEDENFEDGSPNVTPPPSRKDRSRNCII